MNVLVTGGAGYIGSIATKELLKRGHNVIVLDNLLTGNKRLINKECLFVEQDLLDHESLLKTFENNKIQAVLHFAAFSQVGESVQNPQKYFRNNVEGTKSLLKAMSAYQVQKLIFSSSAAIFGEVSEIPIKEDAPKNPSNPYGQSKLMIEDILKEYDQTHGLKSVCLRYFNAAGADPEGELGEMHDPETHLIPLVLKTAKGALESIKIFGTDYDTPDGTCIRDYIHVADLIEAHILALDFIASENKSDQFNLGSEQGFSVREIIDKCKEVTGKDFKVEEKERRAGDPAVLIASSQKIREKLGWQAQRNLDQIIQDAWNWEKAL